MSIFKRIRNWFKPTTVTLVPAGPTAPYIPTVTAFIPPSILLATLFRLEQIIGTRGKCVTDIKLGICRELWHVYGLTQGNIRTIMTGWPHHSGCDFYPIHDRTDIRCPTTQFTELNNLWVEGPQLELRLELCQYMIDQIHDVYLPIANGELPCC